jgi:glycosyltransferase involved in cell wall biosynthesis
VSAVEVGSGSPRQLSLLSIVAPVLDEQDTVRELHARVCRALAGVSFELIVVDDGSTDATPEILAELAKEDPRVRPLRLSRNFGHQAALTAGLDHAQGDACVMIDGDLQDPPEVIPDLVEWWRRGSDVVVAVRVERDGETRFKLATARWFYRAIGRLGEIDLHPDAGDFRLLDRRALDALLQMRERNRYLRGMTEWVGFTHTTVPYRRAIRHAGSTKFSLMRMIRFGLDAVASFSYFPLQIATLVGFIFAAIAFLGIPVAVGFRITGQFVPGVTTAVIAVLLLGGMQLMAIGIIGEYVGRIYDEVKRRPLYILRDDEADADGARAEDRVSRRERASRA